MNLHLYFDSNTESGETAMAYSVYEGTMRLRPILSATVRGSATDEQYMGYNQYMYKLETVRKGLEDLRKYIKENNLNKHDQVNITCYSQHTAINTMLSDRTSNSNYTGKLEEILGIVDEMGEENIVVSIAYVKGKQNYAKKLATDLMMKIRLEPKKVTLNNTSDKISSTIDKLTEKENKVVEIKNFKVM